MLSLMRGTTLIKKHFGDLLTLIDPNSFLHLAHIKMACSPLNFVGEVLFTIHKKILVSFLIG